MQTIPLQISEQLVIQLESYISDKRPLEHILTEAVQFWLLQQQHQQVEQSWEVLRQANLVMEPAEQAAWAQSVQAVTAAEVEPMSRVEMERGLANLTPPLSEEILQLRGDY